MKRMKRTMSVLLSTMLVMVSVCMPLSITASAWEARTNQVDLRVGFLNDTHITNTGSGENQTIAALGTLKTLGMEKLAFVGDNVYYTNASDDPTTDVVGYTKLKSAVTTAGWNWSDVLAYAMGNHEFPQSNTDATVSANSIQVFEQQSGFTRQHHAEHNDFHFIAAAPETYNNNFSTATEEYLMAEIDKALAEDSSNDVEGVFAEGVIPNSNKPVFLLLHQPIEGTIANQTGDRYSDEFVEFLSKRPQVINITAHMHLLAQQPDIICQDAGFTAFQTPTAAGGYQTQWGYEEEGHITDAMCSQGSFVEVKDNVVYLYRIDYTNGTYIGEPFVVDIPAIVADRSNADTTDDNNHMPYRTEVRNAVTSTAAFPAGATVTTKVQDEMVEVTFPNTATMTSSDSVQQDNFIRGYKVELKNASGVVDTDEFQADFWKAPANRAASYTRYVSGLMAGTEYTVNVYPRTPFGAYGTPISATFETEKDKAKDYSVRVEFATDDAKLNYASDYASNKDIMFSDWTGISKWIPGSAGKGAISDNREPYVFTATVNAPIEGTYATEYAVNNCANNLGGATYLSRVTISVDNTTIGDNINNTVLQSLAIDGTYPTKYTPLTLFQGSDVVLKKGENEITVTVDMPTYSGQPFVFSADYIDFIPKTTIIDLEAKSRIEAENHISGVEVEEHNTAGEYVSTTKAKANDSGRASGGKFAGIDSLGTWDGPYTSAAYVDMTIPIYVGEEGCYDMEYVVIYNTKRPSIYLDDTNGTALNATFSQTIDDQVDADGKFSYFNSGWAKASIETSKGVKLPAGAHNIIVRFHKDSDGMGIAQYLDYVQFTPATDRLTVDGSLHYEAEANISKFIAGTETISHSSASGGSYVRRGYGDGFSFSFPFTVEQEGTYQIEMGAATDSYLSPSTVAIDDGEETKISTLTDEGELFADSIYTLHKLVKSVTLKKGFHELKINVPSRGAEGVAFAFDYFRIFMPIDEVISQDDATRIELENYGYAGDKKSLAAASGDSYLLHSYRGYDPEPDVNITVKVRNSGYYNIEYLFGNRKLFGTGGDYKNLSGIDMYLGDAMLGSNDDAYYERLDSAGFSDWTTAPMCRYFKDAVWIDAGVYDFKVDIKSPEYASGIISYQMDYVEFRPVDGIVEVDGNNVKAHINSKDAMTGKVILAVYDNKQLVRTETKDITDGRYANITASKLNLAGTGNATSVKAFVIDGYDNVKPLVVHQEFEIK